jgi:hypothetical protein
VDRYAVTWAGWTGAASSGADGDGVGDVLSLDARLGCACLSRSISRLASRRVFGDVSVWPVGAASDRTSADCLRVGVREVVRAADRGLLGVWGRAAKARPEIRTLA